MRLLRAPAASLATSLMLSAGALGAPASPAAAQESWPAPDPRLLARAAALLEQAPLIDGHNDLPSKLLMRAGGDPRRLDLMQPQPAMHTDLPRLRAGRVGAQFWSAYVTTDSMEDGAALRQALREIDMVRRLVDAYPDQLQLARTADDVERARRAGRIASLIGVEGGHAIEGSLSALRQLHELGARYLTLTHSRTTEWADATTDFPRHRGLTEFGEEVVREMNRLGMFVDLSHVSAETMHDALRVAVAPVLFSHSSARAINAHPRNVPDDVLRRLPANGGVVMINFSSGFIAPTAMAHAARRDSVAESLRGLLDDPAEMARRLRDWDEANPAPRGTIGDVADHIDHVRKLAGIDHIGIGSDYDGIRSLPVGLDDVSTYPTLFAELLRRGYGDDDVRKIAGRNLLRAMRQMEQVAARLQKERAASTVDQRP
ncbi:MAG TPA: dipeptidase [Gemmatimonadaceae bacterium]|nr:dipeptidase [Gemmatimonadaceae bacterium]